MLKEIEINNFRQFDKLKIEDFGKINFFVGKNNCGKSSALEAIDIFLGKNRPRFSYLNGLRDMSFRKDDIKTLFHNLNFETPIDINGSFTDDDKVFNLNIKRLDLGNDALYLDGDNKDLINRLDVPDIQVKYEDDYTVVGVNLNFPANINGALRIKQISNSDILLKINTIFINDKNIKNSTIRSRLKEIDITNRKDELINLLSYFNVGVEDFSIFNNKVYLQLSSLKEKILLNSMGDGFIKYFTIISSIISDKIKYILIDEIDNGMHFLTIKEILKVLLKLSRDRDYQFFITTHNYEVLKYLSDIMQDENYSNQKKDVRIINISKTKNKGFQSYNYSVDGLIEFIDTETEIRD